MSTDISERVEDLREEYAQGELDNDRNPSDDGFVEWLVRRLDRGAS